MNHTTDLRAAPIRTRLTFALVFSVAAFALLGALGFFILSLAGLYRASIPPHLTLLLVSLGTITGLVFAGLLVATKAAAVRLANHLS